MVFGQMPPQKDLPAVIRDAMKVCIDMGYTYLWIVKFCIDQHNPEEKQRQIRQMDSIYHNAELTIIAAAGSDPTYGLPGISHSRPRKPPPTVTIKDIHIISTLRHPQVAIQSSKWSTRGWTLQEAILSRSRLVFTDDQVYFECNARNCQESLSIPFDTFHVKDKSKFRSIMRAGVFGRGNKDKQYGLFDEAAISPMDNFFRFIDIAQQYTARNLTHDSDSLKALYGIVQEFENSKSQILQIHGIPFLSCVPNKALVSFLNALT
uniref:Tol protein n=1 Tax=Colletotrichum fructicola (strain Nara gc5) TaxID=1213859 RepID=L2FIJ3_COLFN